MSPFATLKDLRRASQLIKRTMNFVPEGWNDTKERGREALHWAIEQSMAEQVKSYLEDSQSRGVEDRRNGTIRRHLLTGLGDIKLAIPRTRQYRPLSVAQAYAGGRRAWMTRSRASWRKRGVESS